MLTHRIVIAAALAVGHFTAQAAFEACPQFFPGKPPVVAAPSKQQALCFDAFAVLYSAQSKTPVFVAERLNAASLGDAANQQRTDRFYPEARLPFDARAQLNDYKGSGYSRGHMAPAADMPNPQAMAQSFSLANVVPQNRENNSGAWAKIETATRSYAKRAAGDVFVLTGPVFEPRVSTVGQGSVWVPQRLFKVVYTPSTGRAWAYLQANTDGAQSLKPITYPAFVRETGLAVLEGLTIRD